MFVFFVDISKKYFTIPKSITNRLLLLLSALSCPIGFKQNITPVPTPKGMPFTNIQQEIRNFGQP